MKKKLLFVTFATAISLGLTNCGNKAEKSSEIGSVTNLEVAEITELSQKPQEEITSKDYDFLLDQAEVFANDIKNMTPEKFNDYKKDLKPEELAAMTYMAKTINSAIKNGKLSEEQLKRFEEMTPKNTTPEPQRIKITKRPEVHR